jgi:integrase
MWHGRYYVDVIGSTERRRVSVPLGSISAMTKPEARRKLRAMLEEMGLNDDSHLERTARGGRTFAEEAAWWRENRLPMFKPSCQETMGSHIDKYLLPQLGTLPMAAIHERRVQEFVTYLSRVTYKWPNGRVKPLAPKTIKNIIGVLKLIVGEKVWSDWKLSLPEDPERDQRCFSPDEMRSIVNVATGQWKPLFATMAGGGMRCGEVFGLHVEDLDLHGGRIFVRRSVWNGQEIPVKTKKGYRVVNIEPALVQMLAAHLRDRKGGRVFKTRNGTPFCKNNVNRKLKQILKKLNLAPGGLHAFRHGRVSLLQENRVPGDLVLEWIGHSSLRTTSRYTHFRDDFRKQVASEVGLFAQPSAAEKLPVGPNGPNSGVVATETGTA